MFAWHVKGICSDGEWSCLDGSRCIADAHVCDDRIHCADGSDESTQVCEVWQCAAGKWKCPHNKCISSVHVCDDLRTSGLGNCGDGSDEANELCAHWNCSSGRWKCKNNLCISTLSVCDDDQFSSVGSCEDGSDEDVNICIDWQCQDGMWKCDDNLQCINEFLVCDGKTGFSHCNDGSDEAHCDEWVCPEGTWRCKNGIGCLRLEFVCDATHRAFPQGCDDMSDEDEELCYDWICMAGFWRCKDNSICIIDANRMDGFSDCRDGSDEDPQYHKGRTCPDDYRICDDGMQCLNEQHWCDGYTWIEYESHGCRDGSDEGHNCEHWECHPDYWRCKSDLICIDAHDVCDKISQCPDMSDEHNELCGCDRKSDIPCRNGDGCVRAINVCDGFLHCADKSDELEEMCIPWICTSNMWKCKDNKKCIVELFICDGKTDCLDSSDETDCYNYKCPYDHYVKCADNLQCVLKYLICDGITDCVDGSDELCKATCLPHGFQGKNIIQRCSEDITKCFPMERFCDRRADCPLGSDEAASDCSCEDWNMLQCNGDSDLCIYKEWMTYEGEVVNFCRNTNISLDNLDNYKHNLDKEFPDKCFIDKCDIDVDCQGNISQAIELGHQDICLSGAYTKLAEIINLTDISGQVRVFGQGTLVNYSIISVVSSQSTLVLSDIILQETVIIVSNVFVSFIRCTLVNVLITDAAFPQSKAEIHTQIALENCTLLCNENDSVSHGIELKKITITILSIKQTIVRYCKIEVHASSVIFALKESLLFQVPTSVTVSSHLRVPTFITFQNSQVVPSSYKYQVIRLDLYNPFVLITNCTFDRVSVQIISLEYYFRQSLYFVKITETSFREALNDGDGGALFVKTNVKNSTLYLVYVTFIGSKAVRSSSFDGGKGGAIFVDGTSLYMTLENCLFINNTSSEDGSALYTSQGVTVLMKSSSIKFAMDGSIWQPLITIYGKTEVSNIEIQLENNYPSFYTMDLTIFRIEHLFENSFMSVSCPPWHRHLSEYRLAATYGSSDEANHTSSQVYNFIYMCGICTEGYYTTSVHRSVISYNMGTSVMYETPEAKLNCIHCPYGAFCTGNNVIPRPNFWGYWHKSKLIFQQCPAGFCCSGTETAPCKSFDSCAGNRTGILCGACQKGFTVSILTGECTPNNQCARDQWFWMLVPLATLAYAMWYTFKNNIFELVFKGIRRIFTSFKKHRVFATKGKKTPASMDAGENDISPAKNELKIDKGYFGIVAYFVQTAAIIKIHIEFSDVARSEPFIDKLVNNIEVLLNFELTQFSFDACPIVGLTTLGKQVYRFIFLFGIYISWAFIFLFVLTISKLLQSRNAPENLTKHLQLWELQLVKGYVEIIKYTYSGFCSIIFMSLICVNIGDKYVWWHDGTNVCLENWQILIITFGACYALPFPLTLFLGMKWLRKRQISTVTFLCSCLCPITPFYFLLIRHCKEKPNSSTMKFSKTSDVVLSVLQGPYKEEGNDMTAYWEAVISGRRLLISIMTLVSYASIRMIIITTMCVLFLCHHITYLPFKAKASNYAESFSLLLFVLTSVINLFKACLTDSGVIPTGPSVQFFKGLELCEKMFVFLLIAYILAIELWTKHKIATYKIHK